MNGNYGLIYPNEKDYYDVNVTNENFSKLADGIDSVKSGGLKKEVVVAAYNSANPYKEVADYVCTKNNAAEIFNKAIEDCNEGGVVLLLDGDYYINSVVNINKTITLWGYGAKTRIIQADDLPNYSMFLLSAPNITLKDITFEDSITAGRAIHLVSVSSNSVAIGGCDFYMNRSDENNSVAPVYTENYSCRILMVGCYIRKHDDGKYVINGSNSIVYGVVMGNYCENIDTDGELSVGINVKNIASAQRIKHGAQNTQVYVNGGEYNG